MKCHSLVTLLLATIALSFLLGACNNEKLEVQAEEMCEGADFDTDAFDRVAATAHEARPLIAGLVAPAFSIPTSEGDVYSFDPEGLERPVVLIFYRGGWCPWCNRHLSALRTVEPELISLGYDVLFISADSEENLRPTLKMEDVDYTLLSDNEMTVAQDYGVAFHVDDQTVERYLNGGIDLEAASGYSHHILPIPATFVIGTDGLIQFMYANPDYRTRVHPELLLKAARLAVGTES